MSYADFIAAVIDLRNEVNEDLLKKAFQAIGGIDSEYITKQQLFDTI